MLDAATGKRKLASTSTGPFLSPPPAKRSAPVVGEGPAPAPARPVAAQPAAEARPLSRDFVAFPTQAEAFSFCDSFDGAAEDRPWVWSFDLAEGSGKRRFIAATPLSFFSVYHALPKSQRFHYEVLRETKPVNLFFDLEFSRVENPGRDEEAMVDAVLRGAFALFWERFGVRVGRQDVVDLESGSPEKFSRHLVVRVPGCAFHDHASCGAFVDLLIDRLCSTEEGNRAVRVKPNDTFFIDTGVYTRNRNFRLLNSSKRGKARYLVISKSNKYPWTGPFDFFMASLVGNVPRGSRILYLPRAGGGGASGGAASVPVTATAPIPIAIGSTNNQQAFAAVEVTPELMALVERLSGGQVRSYKPLSPTRISFPITGKRFCGAVQREHKSNGIFYVADFEKRVVYQRCFDPDCKRANFKGEEVKF